MTSEYYIIFSIYGRKAVEVAKKFQGNYCYRGIFDHGKRIAQLEVVVDEPGTYNGLENAWIDVTCERKYVDKTLKQLSRLGFKNEYALVLDYYEDYFEDPYTEYNASLDREKEYCFIKI